MPYFSILPFVITFHLVLVDAGDPGYPELGDNPRLENKVKWPNMGPNYKAPPHKDTDPWFLVLESNSKMSCQLQTNKKYQCDSVKTVPPTTSASFQNKEKCQAWCEDGPTTKTPQLSVEWHSGAYCMYDSVQKICKLEACDNPTFVDDNNFFSSACEENTDFAYGSSIWDAIESDFVDDNDATSKCSTVSRTDTSELPNC